MRAVLAIALLAALPASAEESLSPLDLARQVAIEGPLYAYDMTFEMKDFSANGKVDPAQPEGKRVTIYSPEREDWPKDFEKGLKQIDAEADGDIWCSGMLDAVPANAELISNEDGIAQYSFKPAPEDKEDAKFMKHLTGTIDIDRDDGSVLSFSMFSKEAFKPNIMVKVKSFRLDAKCARGPDGRTYAAEVDSKVTASAAMQSIEEHTVRKITALYPVN